jgi:DNA polymerase-1
MRSCFIANEGIFLLAADYSQIELRILAHMSQEPSLLDAFNNNEDIHTRTARLLFEQEGENISPDQRRKAKTINFGLIYGMGPQKLSRELGITLNAAKEFIFIYFSKLKKVNKFFEQVEKQAQDQGYISTILGRRRLIQDINSQNTQLAAQAKRLAINTIIQGSAADIIKLAMIQTDSDPLLKKLQAELILQIHDELLFEVPKENAEMAGQRVAEIMSEVVRIDLPLTVDWGYGESWAKAH